MQRKYFLRCHAEPVEALPLIIIHRQAQDDKEDGSSAHKKIEVQSPTFNTDEIQPLLFKSLFTFLFLAKWKLIGVEIGKILQSTVIIRQSKIVNY